MKNMKRAIRRHHRQRLINNVTNYQRSYWHTMSTLEERRETATRSYDTVKNCSCWMCGNPRKLGEETMQERKFK